LPGCAAVEVARVVLDAGAVPDLGEHFEIVVGALFETRRFKKLALLFKFGDTRFQFRLNVGDGKF
jgi:hypothetical protein